MILIRVYKCRSKNTSQLWSKVDGRPIFSEIMSRKRYQQCLGVLLFDDTNARRKNKSNDKLPPIRDVFEKWD